MVLFGMKSLKGWIHFGIIIIKKKKKTLKASENFWQKEPHETIQGVQQPRSEVSLNWSGHNDRKTGEMMLKAPATSDVKS